MDNHGWKQCIQALDAFYRAIDEERYEEAYEMLSERDKKYWSLDQFLAAREGDYHPHRWTLTPLRTARRTVRRENATQDLRIAYVYVEFPLTSRFTTEMIQENGQWKLCHGNMRTSEWNVISEIADGDDVDLIEPSRTL
jgi:hypothetical protein